MDNSFAQRLDMVRSTLPQWGVGGLLVTNLVNCAWLSGFTGSAATLLITADTAVLATDSRYWEQAAAQAPTFELFKHTRLPQDTAAFILAAGVDTIGIEANHVTLQQAEELREIAGVAWHGLNRPIEPMRRIKSAAEITAVQAAAVITDSAMARLPILARPAISERELAWQLERQMREEGASGMAFSPIVAFGPNSARPHHSPGDRQLQTGEIILVDMGARLNGYTSDLTRTFYFGDSPDALFQEIFAVVLAAQTKALDGIKAGIDSQEAHLLAAAVIAEAGYGAEFTHGLGHGLGLEIHEDPFLSATRPPQVLDANMVITIEPGVYLPGWGGVRIEDLVIVTKDGTHCISRSPKDSSLIRPQA